MIISRKTLKPACIQGDARALPFQDECLDSIVSVFPAGFMLDQAVLCETARVLVYPRPSSLTSGGRLIVVGLCLQANSRLLRFAMRLLFGSSPEAVMGEFSRLAGRAGLRVTKIIPGSAGMPVPVLIAEKGVEEREAPILRLIAG
jgi:hypothetical protein